MNSSLQLLSFRRAEFQGRSDKYAPPLANPNIDLSLEKVLTGTAAVDVSGSTLSDRFALDTVTRLSEYRRFWQFYYGRHFYAEYDGGMKKTPWNFCRKIVDKRASWIAGKGFNFISEKGNELVANVLDNVWKANNKKTLLRKSAKVSLTCGDAFWFFTLKSKDKRGKELPKDKWHVKIQPLNPAYVFPIWLEDDPSTMEAVMLQFPIWGNASKKVEVFTAFYTHDTVTYYRDYVKELTVKNELGLIPIVHIPNSPVGEAMFGRSCLDDIIPLNEAYNEVAVSVARILKYHGEPTTLVYGAKLANMERSANKIWSNLPPPGEAKVENLEMKGDLGAAEAYMARLEAQIYHHGKTPKMAFDPEGMHVSNTSGMAMQLMFQPLIEASIEEQENYAEGIRKGNEIIAAIHRTFLAEDLSLLADEPDTYLDLDVCFQSLLPKDEQMELDNAAKKIASGIWSKAEAARRLSGVKDTEKLALEIAADHRHEIAMEAEKARALSGQVPNMSAVFTSSMFLSEDCLDIAAQTGDGSDSKDE